MRHDQIIPPNSDCGIIEVLGLLYGYDILNESPISIEAYTLEDAIGENLLSEDSDIVNHNSVEHNSK